MPLQKHIYIKKFKIFRPYPRTKRKLHSSKIGRILFYINNNSSKAKRWQTNVVSSKIKLAGLGAVAA